MLHKSSGTNSYPLNTYLHVCLVACKLTHEVFVKWKFRTYCKQFDRKFYADWINETLYTRRIRGSDYIAILVAIIFG